MKLKKSKSSSKKSINIDDYKSITDDIFDYAGRHHFHTVITNMLYAVYNAKAEDPYNFMINYLVEKKGRKYENYVNQDLLKEIQQKDDEIKKLNDRIAYLETLTADQRKNSSLLKGSESNVNLPEQNATTSEEKEASNMDSLMTSTSDVKVLVPTKQENINVSILSINLNGLIKSESCEATQEVNNSSEKIEVSGSEIIEKVIEVPEKIVKSVNNFDDFEPDYEPDED